MDILVYVSLLQCDYVTNREHSRLELYFILLLVASLMRNTMLGTQYIHVLMNK